MDEVAWYHVPFLHNEGNGSVSLKITGEPDPHRIKSQIEKEVRIKDVVVLNWIKHQPPEKGE